jgi:hypothetical protein
MKPKLYIPSTNPGPLSIIVNIERSMVELHSADFDLCILRLSMVSQPACSTNGIITVSDTYFKNLLYKDVRYLWVAIMT